MNKQAWYKLSIKEVFTQLESTDEGLSPQQVELRQQRDGLNELPRARSTSAIQLLLSQFKDVLIVVLLLAALASLVTGLLDHQPPTEALLIFGIVMAIALVGFFNEYKAEKTVAALNKLMAYRATVRRAGRMEEVDARQLVVGDIVLLAEGARVPADARVYLAESLRLDEASLTGESTAVSKKNLQLKKMAVLGDQKNMIFSGTYVVSGSGEAVVVATGQTTELGRIARLVQEVKQEPTPMQQKLDALGRRLGFIILGLCLLVFVVILLLEDGGQKGLHRLVFAFTAAVALAVAAIPEGLAFVVRISLALGARRMAAQNALVRRLSAVEALGSTDVICSDKTGTLTRGQMTVRNLWVDGQILTVSGEGYDVAGSITLDHKAFNSDGLNLLLSLGALCNDARLKSDGIIGDPTEAALLVSAQKCPSVSLSGIERLKSFPFNSQRKMMSSLHKDRRGQFVAVKGAPDVVLENCNQILIDGKLLELTAARRAEVLRMNSQFASQALRVLGFATKDFKKLPETDKTAETKLVFVGLQAMIDPPRREVAEVINRVQSEAGMRVMMITGDHVDTARAIASELGIVGKALTGVEIEALSESELIAALKDTSVFARVNPEHKIRIVQALKKLGHQVAMTGDGVNDAPAIKAADIGIAMGITGSDVTKEAADLILLDDQFLTIIKAIEEGRGIFDNVRKFVNFLLSANIAEVLTILAGIIFARKLLLSAPQLLFINIVTDGLPAIALGSDPAARLVMRFKPKRYQSAILNNRTWVEIFIFGILMTAALLLLYKLSAPAMAVSVVFVGMVVFEMARLVDIRTDYKIRWLSNPLLTVSIAISLLLLCLVVYVEPLAKIFELDRINAGAWTAILALSVLSVVIMKLLNKPLNIFGREHD